MYESQRQSRLTFEDSLTQEEQEAKGHNIFIHDKLVFDAYNHALDRIVTQPAVPLPWDTTSPAVMTSREVYDR